MHFIVFSPSMEKLTKRIDVVFAGGDVDRVHFQPLECFITSGDLLPGTFGIQSSLTTTGGVETGDGTRFTVSQLDQTDIGHFKFATVTNDDRDDVMSAIGHSERFS